MTSLQQTVVNKMAALTVVFSRILASIFNPQDENEKCSEKLLCVYNLHSDPIDRVRGASSLRFSFKNAELMCVCVEGGGGGGGIGIYCMHFPSCTAVILAERPISMYHDQNELEARPQDKTL